MHLIVIGGPTATGKTALAADLAQALNADIVSADSRQVYRGLDLGTGKDLSEFQKCSPPIRYHLIDIKDPEEVYSLFQFQQDCYHILVEISKSGAGRRDIAVMVGGTGMYIESVLRQYHIANIPENPALRSLLWEKSHEQLELQLRVQDPVLATRTDLTSKKRIIRALEIAATGLGDAIPYSPKPEVDFTFTFFVTTWERQDLRDRIAARLEERLAAGMVEEVSNLIRQGVSVDRLRSLGMEYREITDFILGVKDYATMVKDLCHQIHLLAKRQETYFRGMERRGVPIHWLHRGDGVDTIHKVLHAHGGDHG